MARSFKFSVGVNESARPTSTREPVNRKLTNLKTTATVYRATDPLEATLILAHGAGAPQSHPFMVDMATRLAARGVDVVTFNFLYADAGRTLPDRAELLEATWRAAISAVRAKASIPSARLFIGGKSMGGRMAARIATNSDLALDGVVLLGYPLRQKHKTKRGDLRREILDVTEVPILIVQGTRDDFGTAAELKRFVTKLPQAKVHAVPDGDHSLVVRRRRRDGRACEDQERVLADATRAIVDFLATAAR